MRNKVLIIGTNKKESEELETILHEIVEEGGELFFTDSVEDGWTILKKERPQIILLDELLVSDDPKIWEQEGGHLIIMQKKHERISHDEDFVYKPFRSHQVLEKCRASLGKEPVAQLPPM